MNSWSRATLGNPYNQQLPIGNNYITNRPTYNVRCSFGNQKTNINLSPKKPYDTEKIQHISPNKTCRPSAHYEIKSVAELKASGETRNTMTNSGAIEPVFEGEIKVINRMEEIGSLLSEFKTKFASIQQKYSLKAKEAECSKGSKY